MLIPITTGSYKQRSRHLNPSRCVNFYPVIDTKTEGNKSPVAYYTAAGYTLFASAANTGPVRGMYYAAAVSRAFCVIDAMFYEVSSLGVLTNRGTVTSTTGRIKMRSNPFQLMIINCSSTVTEGYIFTYATNTLASITDVNYPGATELEYQDGYFFVIWKGAFYWSTPDDGTSWNALNQVTPSYQSDPLQVICTLKQDIICMGTNTINPYYNDGVTPFVRKPNYSIQYGVAAVASVLEVDETIFFLTNSAQGNCWIARINAYYSMSPVSTEAIDYQISQYAVVSDAIAISYKEANHLFYQLTFPSAGHTWVYDVTTEQWHERESLQPNGVTRGRHTANSQMFAFGLSLIGDCYTGNIWQFSQNVYTENGNQIRGFLTSDVLSQEDRFMRLNSLEIDMSTGVANATGQGSNPQLMLQISKNNGAFGNEWWQQIGKVGQYQNRVKYNRLGTARNWVFKLAYAEPLPMEIIRIVAHGSLETVTTNQYQEMGVK